LACLAVLGRPIFWAIVSWATLGALPASAALPPDLSANGYPIEARLTAVFVLPGEAVTIRYLPSYRGLDDAGRATLAIAHDQGTSRQLDSRHWRYQPPDQPYSDLHLTAEDHTVTVRVFRLTPWPAGAARLQNFAIGDYPDPAGRGAQALAYQRPAGLLAVPAALRDIRVSEHFRLRQFLTGELSRADTPYIALTTPLLEALEHLLGTLRERRWEGDTLTILSAYRTPLHNASVGGARYSRHIYGDAVDLIADADGDGRMDDLNDSGTSDREDVEWLIARFMRQALPVTLGGAGSYDSAGPAAAFLHLDTRGQPADWQR
jgi:hypothetical protein